MIRVTTDEDRWYFKDGIAHPNVTGITAMYPKGPGFENWLIGMPTVAHKKIELESAGERGTNVHNAVDTLMHGHSIKWVDYTDEEWRMINAFHSWYTVHEPTVIDVEFSVFGNRGGKRYAGTVDLLCEIDGEKWIVDWKTSGGIYASHKVQVAAYAFALRQQRPDLFPGEGFPRAAVVQLGSSHKRTKKLSYGPGFKMEEVDVSDMLPVFDACYTLWEAENPGASPRTVDILEEIVL